MFTQKVGVRTATTNNYSLKTNNAISFKGASALPRSEKIVESPAIKFMKKFFSFVPRIDFLKTFNNRLRNNSKIIIDGRSPIDKSFLATKAKLIRH